LFFLFSSTTIYPNLLPIRPIALPMRLSQTPSTLLSFADMQHAPATWLPAVAQAGPHPVLIDATVYELHATRMPWLAEHPLLTIPSGEQHKTLANAQRIWEWLHAQKAGRYAHPLIIGGGVTTDIGAFACSTWKRGLPFTLLPTTLLGMADAAHGGKTGIDFLGGKNLVGTFAPAVAVVVDVTFLSTLPERELRSGFAEVLKHALLDSPDLWRRMLRFPLQEQYWPELIRYCAQYKQRIVDQDPTEQGPRKLLNLGHTLGHALESALLNTPTPILHGEAVAAGLWAEAVLAANLHQLNTTVPDELAAAFAHFGYRLRFPEASPEAILAYLAQDKKNQGQELRFSLLRHIGHADYDVAVPYFRVEEVVALLCTEA
jgi:3-dehydroquinate synthase